MVLHGLQGESGSLLGDRLPPLGLFTTGVCLLKSRENRTRETTNVRGLIADTFHAPAGGGSFLGHAVCATYMKSVQSLWATSHHQEKRGCRRAGAVAWPSSRPAARPIALSMTDQVR
ncbi:hypothetical protein MRX96_057150 [Rhipicephalus microplus]